VITKVAGNIVPKQNVKNKSQISMGNGLSEVLSICAKQAKTLDTFELERAAKAFEEQSNQEEGFGSLIKNAVAKEIFYKRENGEIAGIAKEKIYNNGKLVEEVTY